MKRLLRYFVQGLVITVPTLVTGYVCYVAFVTLDGWLRLPVPGAGFVITIVAITLIGAFGSSLITRSLIAALDSVLERLPFVRLLYHATKDLMNAFVGEKRRFDAPVLVAVTPDSEIKHLGFITQKSLALLGEAKHVAVYCPHSYNFSGQLWVVPRDRVTPVDSVSSEFMAFVVSGGVTDVPHMK
ncbi:MAG TPA: DUF502 domain-containing protein [Gemmatimonadaceae bacterium]|nr:DUF502 domain-containing protein [Gemmatimonadaceae bacterium]